MLAHPQPGEGWIRFVHPATWRQVEAGVQGGVAGSEQTQWRWRHQEPTDPTDPVDPPETLVRCLPGDR